MAAPLSAAPNAILNSIIPSAFQAGQPFLCGSHEARLVYSFAGTTDIAGRTPASVSMSSPQGSSPFMNSVMDGTEHASGSQENMSPSLASKPASAQTQAPATAVPASVSGKPARPASRILSGSELSPLKILQNRVTVPAARTESPASPDSNTDSNKDMMFDQVSTSPSPSASSRSLSSSSTQMMPPAAPLGRAPRKITSPDKRFPVKINVASTPSFTAASPPASAASPRMAPLSSPSGHALFHPKQPGQGSRDRQLSIDEAVGRNDGLKQAIDIFEDENSAYDNGYREPEGVAAASANLDDSAVGADDTMTSAFSAFSAVPNTLSRGNGGRASLGGGDLSPKQVRANGGNGPAPNRTAHYEHGSTTSLLMDFTEQLRVAHSQQQASLGQYGSSTHGGASATATPQRKNLVNILDFEIPPLPTPRSIPSVTPRELESLKSKFTSDISGLKATLSGKEAEVSALKTALGDAEKRVGECTEQLHELQAAVHPLRDEKDMWERRGREMEEVLRKVKGEIVLNQREREELEHKLDESEKRREAAEMMAQEAETKMAVMRAGRATADHENKVRSPGGPAPVASSTQREVEIAVERVARELHAAYKAKHETKVTALKKSYEARWEKRVRELEAAAESLARENDSLRRGQEAMLARLVPGEDERQQKEEERRQREARDAAQIKELGAEVHKLEAVVQTVNADNAELRTLLEQERIEKGELVILAEEMMSMQQSFVAPPPPSTAETPRAPPKTPSAPRTLASSVAGGGPGTAAPATGKRSSLAFNGPTTTPKQSRPMSMHGTGRMSGLKPPGSSSATGGGPPPSRIGRIGHDRKQSSLGGIPRPGSGLGSRSGLINSIEKMGNYRGRGE